MLEFSLLILDYVNEFFKGGRAFNVSSFLLTIVGFFITFRQLRKTRDAALASEIATNRTTSEISRVVTVADLSRFRGYANEVLGLLRHKNLPAAAIRVSDLRNGMVQLRASPLCSNLQPAEEWQKLVTLLAGIQEAIERPLGDDDTAEFDEKKWRRWMKTMSSILEKLTALETTANVVQRSK